MSICCERLFLGFRDHNALASGEAVRLHDQRRAPARDEIACRRGVLETLPKRGAYTGGVGHLLGEALAAFEPRGGR